MRHISELNEGVDDRGLCHALAQTVLSTEPARRPLFERDTLTMLTDGLLALLELSDLPDYEEHAELTTEQAEKFSLLREFLGRLSQTADKKLAINITLDTCITVDFVGIETE